MAQPNPDRPNMRAWCSRHPALLAAIFLSLAKTGRNAANVLRVSEATDRGAKLPIPRKGLDRWLSFYRNHRRVAEESKSYAGQDSTLSSMCGQFQSVMAELQAIPEAVEDPWHPAVEMCGQHMLALFFQAETAESSSQPALTLDMQDPRLLAWWYKLTVELPCTLLYREFPVTVLRRARNGDLDSMRKLLLVDRNIKHEKRVREIIYENPEAGEMVATTLSKHLPRVRPSRWKVMASASMRYVAEKGFRYQLTYRDIADLFHAMARDCDGAVDDHDLSAMQGRSFERQVADAIQQGEPPQAN